MISVILADDHRMVRDALRHILEADDEIQILGVVANGMEALVVASQNCPDVAILDIAMPSLDGLQTAAQIQEICPRTAILLLSMHHSSAYVKRARRAGVRGYLVKEAAGFDLVAAVRILHNGGVYFSPETAQIDQNR